MLQSFEHLCTLHQSGLGETKNTGTPISFCFAKIGILRPSWPDLRSAGAPCSTSAPRLERLLSLTRVAWHSHCMADDVRGLSFRTSLPWGPPPGFFLRRLGAVFAGVQNLPLLRISPILPSFQDLAFGLVTMHGQEVMSLTTGIRGLACSTPKPKGHVCSNFTVP